MSIVFYVCILFYVNPKNQFDFDKMIDSDSGSILTKSSLLVSSDDADELPTLNWLIGRKLSRIMSNFNAQFQKVMAQHGA